MRIATALLAATFLLPGCADGPSDGQIGQDIGELVTRKGLGPLDPVPPYQAVDCSHVLSKERKGDELFARVECKFEKTGWTGSTINTTVYRYVKENGEWRLRGVWF